MKILIIDDSYFARQDIESNLKNIIPIDMQVEFYQAGNFSETKKVLNSVFSDEDPALITVDLGMPLTSGKTIIANIRENNFKMPILIITAFTDNFSIFTALEKGGSDYILKPLITSKLRNKLIDLKIV